MEGQPVPGGTKPVLACPAGSAPPRARQIGFFSSSQLAPISTAAFSLWGWHQLPPAPAFSLALCLPFGSGRNDQRPLPCGGLFPRPLLPVPCLCLVVLHVLLSLRCKGGVLLRGETRLPWGSDNALQGVRGYPEIGADRVSGHMCAFQGLHGICQPLGGLACGHQVKPFSPDPHLPLQCLCHLCLPCHQPQTPATCTRSVTVP